MEGIDAQDHPRNWKRPSGAAAGSDRSPGAESGGSGASRDAVELASVSTHASLVDAVDHLLNRGAVLVGEATLSLAGVDLAYVGLNLIVSSVETLRRERDMNGVVRRADGWRDSATEQTSQPGIAPGPEGYSAVGRQPETGMTTTTAESLPVARLATPRSNAESPSLATSEEGPETGLARLVLTLVELLRQVLERQAIRRVEGGGLTDDEVERMGIALLELENKMAELREIFRLEEADLNLDLGPIGKLL